ncbi:hypothetical protein BDF22DRAFT_678637 [Syncephalis plumigaleata]|nr:hypothetical protein BDF22DRAFT_678637 [Syncephalis plumigaleata]
MKHYLATLWLCASVTLVAGASVQRFDERLEQPMGVPAVDVLATSVSDNVWNIPEDDPRLINVKHQIKELADRLHKNRPHDQIVVKDADIVPSNLMDANGANEPHELHDNAKSQQVRADLFPHLPESITNAIKEKSSSAVAHLRHWMASLFGGEHPPTEAATPTHSPLADLANATPVESTPMATNSPTDSTVLQQPQQPPLEATPTEKPVVMDPMHDKLPGSQSQLPNGEGQQQPQATQIPATNGPAVNSPQTLPAPASNLPINNQQTTPSPVATETPLFTVTPPQPTNRDLSTREEIQKHLEENAKLVRNIQDSRPDIAIQNAFGTIARVVIAAARLVASDLSQIVTFVGNAREQNIPMSEWLPKVRKMIITNLRYNFIALADLAATVFRDRVVEAAANISAEQSTNGLLLRLFTGDDAAGYIRRASERWARLFINTLRRALDATQLTEGLEQNPSIQSVLHLLKDITNHPEEILL